MRHPQLGVQTGSYIYQFMDGGFVEFDAKFKFAKIICVCVCGGGFVEVDAEFKFAKIQNSHLCVCVCVWGALWNLMLSSNLLKAKIPTGVCVCVCVGGFCGI